jgi:hypothetical protein
MATHKRWTVAAAVVLLSSILCGAGRYYSPSLIQYVVEQSLVQKAPADADAAYIQERLRAVLSSMPDKKARVQKLIRISEIIEKTQFLTPEDLDRLMAPERD